MVTSMYILFKKSIEEENHSIYLYAHINNDEVPFVKRFALFEPFRGRYGFINLSTLYQIPRINAMVLLNFIYLFKSVSSFVEREYILCFIICLLLLTIGLFFRSEY